ncbi:cobyric acid synthase [Haladaptatus pallidirubidus]|uniref:Probable cobyric acid synthase n=1 Tax=Haladaptatus pallidirubidus TaxID=1008152 RepID=A0AAV3UK33_9EURY|nr:cobyric acid synthase [Haladaptatus pallidirubidus]
MTKTVLVAGTESHVGKSTVAAGLCRLLARRGVSVAPFKAQNMSNNARVVVDPDGNWGEIGISQYVQARAARISATTDMNPVLLKPRGDGESQLVIHGKAVENVAAGSYYESQWERARRAAIESYQRLAERSDVIVAEGAGSIAEINLHHRDLANVETARFADASIILLVNIERGGAFASLYGTLELMPDDVRDRVQGAIITKFRGDEALLTSGIEAIEERTGVPILGVLPYDDPGLPAEDSVSLPQTGERAVFGDDDDIPDCRSVTIGVPRLPRVSNFTDLEPLTNEPGVRVTYLPLDSDLSRVDAVVLPGSKNTVDDLLALQNAGFDTHLAGFSGPIVGLCGGYQMLGERITNAALESTDDHDAVSGFGLLPIETHFSAEKRVERVTQTLSPVELLSGVHGTVSGYEIHMGRTTPTQPIDQPIGEGSAAVNHVLGTYLHGLFENETLRAGFVRAVFRFAGKSPPEKTVVQSSYDDAADLVSTSIQITDEIIDL